MLFQTTILNGVRIIVYPDGTLLKYSHRGTKDYMKGWNIVTGWIDEKTGYQRVMINKRYYSFHRIIGFVFLGLDIENKKIQIDHIDRNKLNNQVSNLRIATQQQNMWNRGFKGYSWNSVSKRYQAQIRVNKKCICLGSYKTKEEAHQAYLDAKKIHHIIE